MPFTFADFTLLPPWQERTISLFFFFCLRSSTADFAIARLPLLLKLVISNQPCLAIALLHRSLPGSTAGRPLAHQRGERGWVGRWCPFSITEGTATRSYVWNITLGDKKKKLGLRSRSLGSRLSTGHFSNFPRQGCPGKARQCHGAPSFSVQESMATRLSKHAHSSREHTQPEPSANTSAATAGQKSKANSTKQIINQVGNHTELIGATVKPSLSKSPSFKLARTRTTNWAAIFWCNAKAGKCLGQGFKSAISTP